MAAPPYFRGFEGHAGSRILRGRLGIDPGVALTEASGRLHPCQPIPPQQNERLNQSTRSRKSPGPGCGRYFAASLQNGHFSQLLLNYTLPDQSESYLEAPNRASVSPISNPRACKLLLILRRASCSIL